MANYSIKDIEKFSGIKAHTLRIWEKRYQIIKPQRTETNIRYYTDGDLKKILNVSILNRNGLKISKISELTVEQINAKVLELIEENKHFESHIENLAIAMIELNEELFDKILSKAIINLGFEDSITQIMYPFFEKIGILWQVGSINPAQEHFVSNLIRQKLISAIDNLIYEPSLKSKKFTLFLPEGELHELGLLFYYYLLKKKGHKVMYLGQTLPFNDLLEVNNIRPCNALVTYFTNVFQSDEEMSAYIHKLANTFKPIKVYISGIQLKAFEGTLPKNARKISSPDELCEILTQ